MITEHEIVISLENGGSLRCGEGQDNQWGGYVRLCDDEGNEMVYWDALEFEEEGCAKSVLGAVFAYSQRSLPEILVALKRTRVVDGCWV
jgi:hypothetical protein